MQEFNFDSCLFPEKKTALKKSLHWTKKCLRNLRRLTEKFGRMWLETACSIDRNGYNNKQKTKIFFQVAENALQDIMDDMNNLKEKHENYIFRLAEELHSLESKLHLPLSLDVTKPRQELLSAIEKNFRSTVKGKKVSESVSLVELEEFLKHLVAERQAELNKQEKDLKILKEKFDSLTTKMGMLETWRETYSPTSLDNFKETVYKLETEFLERKIKFLTLRSAIMEIVTEQGVQLEGTDFHNLFLSLSDDSLTVTDLLLSKMEQLYQYVAQKRDDVVNQIGNLMEELKQLWKCLDFTVSDELSFMSSIKGISKTTIDQLIAEINRLKLFKKNNLEELIETRKICLNKLWDKCDCGGSIRNNFPLIFTTDYNEDMVDLFDREIETWNHYYEDNKKLLETLHVYRSFTNELIKMENNPDRNQLFKNRGGKLLTEVRKLEVLKSKIKKKREELFNLSKIYLQENGTSFLTFDERIESFIEKGQPKGITKTTSSSTPKNTTKRKFKTPSSLPPSGKIIHWKKETPNLPKFKITSPRTTSPKKKVGWKSCRKSLSRKQADADEYSVFEGDVKKNVPRSSSILKE